MAKIAHFISIAKMKQVKSHDVFVGLLCKYVFTPRGGYGFQMRVPARVIELNLQGDRAVIEITSSNGKVHHKTVFTNKLEQ